MMILSIVFSGIMYFVAGYLLKKDNLLQKPQLFILISAIGMALMLIKHPLSGILLPYFFAQTVSDIRDKKVYVLLNNLLLCMVGILFFSQFGVQWQYFLILPIIFCGSVFRLYGSGDAKCLAAVFLLMPHYVEVFETAVFWFLLYLFSSNVYMLLFGFFYQMKYKRKLKRICYFPFLFLGYLSFILGKGI